MLGIGTWEFLLILILALVVLGPSKLPGIAKSLGRGYSEFKRASQELRDSISEDIDISDFKNSIDDAKRSLEADIDATGSYEQENSPEHLAANLRPSDEADSESPQTTDPPRERNSADSFSSDKGHSEAGGEPVDDREKPAPDSPETSGEGEDPGQRG